MSSYSPESGREGEDHDTVTQTASRLSVTLADATFFGNPGQLQNRFSGLNEGERVTFSLSNGSIYYYYFYYYANVIEQITPELFMVPAGQVTGTLSTSGFDGRLDGVIELREGPGPRLRTIATCRSADHRFVLVR